MEIDGSVSIHRDYDNNVFIRVVDHTSHKEFLEVKMTPINFTKLMTGMSGVSAILDVEGLDVVGKKKIVEKRTIAYNGGYDKEQAATWLFENAKEDGWIIDTHLSSRDSFITILGQQHLNYKVYKYVDGETE